VAWIAAIAACRHVALTLSQVGLRCVVRHLSDVCAENNLTYWWDFGTSLGIVREHDIIWTEVRKSLSSTSARILAVARR
jgi:hypothetical protein